MGLITAAVSSVSGTLADSWKDVIEPDDMTDGTLLVKGVAVKKGSNRRGNDNIVSNGSIIHVFPNTLMLLIDGGRIVLTGNKDELMESHGILKCRKQDLSLIDMSLVVSVQLSSFGAEVLVNDRHTCEKQYPDMVIEPASLEEIMIYYVNRAHGIRPDGE